MVLMVNGQEEPREHSSITDNDFLESLLQTAQENLDNQQKEEVGKLIQKNVDLFVAPGSPTGRTSWVRHQIDTGSAKPIKQPPRRMAIAQWEVANQEIDRMLAENVIEPADGPWSSPIVLVKKRDGSTRFCIDYRRVNEVTLKDAYPLPSIQDCLDSLAGSRWFSTVDLASGYWQVEMEEKDKSKTAFATRRGLF
jgi:hypothetical protein